MKHLFRFNEGEEIPVWKTTNKLPEEVYTYLRSLNTGDYECYIQEGFFNKDQVHGHVFQTEPSNSEEKNLEVSKFYSNPAINFIINKKSFADDICFSESHEYYYDDISLVERFLSYIVDVIEHLESMNMIVNYTMRGHQIRLMIRGKR